MGSGAYSRVPQGPVERLFLFAGQRANTSFGKLAEWQRTDRDPDQPQDVNPKRCQHAPNVAVPALVQDNFKPAVALASAQNTHAGDAQEIALFRPDSLPYGFKQRGVSHSVNLHM